MHTPANPSLHYPGAIAVSTLFGGTLAAGYLIAVNLRLLRRGGAFLSIFAGVALQAVLLLVASARLRDPMSEFGLGAQWQEYLIIRHVLPCIATIFLARFLFGADLPTHRPLPATRAVNAGWVCWFLTLLVLLAARLLLNGKIW